MADDNHIKIRMTDSPAFEAGDIPAIGDLLWITDISSGKLRKVTVAQLSAILGGGGGPGGGGFYTPVPNPIMIRNTDEVYHYDEATDTTRILDPRLLNKINYPVFTTQFGGGELPSSQISYKPISDDDSSLGELEISNFKLEDDQHITIITSGEKDITTDTQYQSLLTDVALLKQLAAPFMLKTGGGPNFASIWWNGPLESIPAGWVEDVAMRGVLPMAYSPADDDFKTIGHTGGSKSTSITIAKANLPELELSFGKDNKGGGGGVRVLSSQGPIGPTNDPPYKTGNFGGNSTPITITLIPPHIIGVWIKFAGV